MADLKNIITSDLNLAVSNGYFNKITFNDPVIDWLKKVEIIADLLASEIITPQIYFKLKALLQSQDPEVRNLGLKFIEEKSKLEI